MRRAAIAAVLMTMLLDEGAAQVRRPEAPPPGVPAQPDIPPLMKIRVTGDSVSASLRATPLQMALQELAARTGIVFEVASHLNPPVSLSLYSTSLEEAVRRFVEGNNAIFYYGKDPAGQSQIRVVRIFSRGGKEQQPGLVYIGTGAVTKSGDDLPENPDQALKALSENSGKEVKQKAIEILAAQKDEAAIAALTRSLSDPAEEVRVAAIEGLASLGARGALPLIIQAFKDPHPGVRLSAVEAVSFLGDTENLKDIRGMARDKDAAVAAAAELAIRKLSGR